MTPFLFRRLSFIGFRYESLKLEELSGPTVKTFFHTCQLLQNSRESLLSLIVTTPVFSLCGFFNKIVLVDNSIKMSVISWSAALFLYKPGCVRSYSELLLQ